MPRILITGGNGLLGTKLIEKADPGIRILSVDIDRASSAGGAHPAYRSCDVTDRDSVVRVIGDFRPDTVIHTAAFTGVDACETEKEKAWDINVRGAENVARACRSAGTGLIHLSTDYIFDGKAGPYREDDAPNPISFYGRTKLESERAVFEVMKDALIIRTMVLYGYAGHTRPNFVTWLVSRLREGRKAEVVTDQYGNPTFADHLAGVLWTLREKNAKGVYHVAGKDWLSRYDFALRIAVCFGLDATLIEASTSERFAQAAPRPLKSGLVLDKIRREFGIECLPVDEGLREMKRQMETR